MGSGWSAVHTRDCIYLYTSGDHCLFMPLVDYYTTLAQVSLGGKLSFQFFSTCDCIPSVSLLKFNWQAFLYNENNFRWQLQISLVPMCSKGEQGKALYPLSQSRFARPAILIFTQAVKVPSQKISRNCAKRFFWTDSSATLSNGPKRYISIRSSPG